MKKSKKRIILILILIFSVGLAIALVFEKIMENGEEIEGAGKAEHAELRPTSLTLGEKVVPLKENFSALLVIGTDTIYGDEAPEVDKYAMVNNAMADFMMVFIFDDDAKTVQPLQINRDTMCEVPWLSMNGKVAGYVEQQITFAHMYGTGEKDSVKNCARAVTKLLYKAPIDDSISFTMDTVPIMNDLVGGVTVKVTEDIPGLGKEYVAGAEITLHGQQALKFVRYRDNSVLESNTSRMQNHILYLNAFIPLARQKVSENENFILTVLDALNPYLNTEMTVEKITEYANKFCEYEILPTITYSGTYERGTFAEFYPNDDSLISCIKQAYCTVG